MHTLINGSQKLKNNNSKYFLNYIGQKIDDYQIFDLKKDDYQDIIDTIKVSDNIVIAFPLYVDSPNTMTLSFLDYIIDQNIKINKKIYVIINCGFREGKHNVTALNIIKNWIIKVGGTYGGCVLIGAGEVAGDKKYKFLSKKIFSSLDKLSTDIKENNISKDYINTISLLTNHLYCLVANASWRKNAKKNGVSKKEIKQL